MAALTANFELGSNGATIATSDPGDLTPWDGVAGAVYSNTHVAHGTLSGKAPGGSSTQMRWDLLPGVTEQYGRAYFYLTDYAADNAGMVVGNNSFTAITLWSDTSSSIIQVGGTTNFATPYVLNQWMRIEWFIIHSTTVGQVEARLFLDADSTTPTETKTTAANLNTGTEGTSIEFRSISGTASHDLYYDALVANATDWVGPVVGATTVDVLMPRHGAGMGRW